MKYNIIKFCILFLFIATSVIYSKPILYLGPEIYEAWENRPDRDINRTGRFAMDFPTAFETGMAGNIYLTEQYFGVSCKIGAHIGYGGGKILFLGSILNVNAIIRIPIKDILFPYFGYGFTVRYNLSTSVYYTSLLEIDTDHFTAKFGIQYKIKSNILQIEYAFGRMKYSRIGIAYLFGLNNKK